MKIATLNIRHGGGRRTKLIASYLEKLELDCLLLTEYRDNVSGNELSFALSEQGFIHQSSVISNSKINQLRWFSKHPFKEESLPFAQLTELQQRICAIKLEGISLIGVYFPQGKAKGAVFDCIRSTFSSARLGNSILLGDFNTGMHWIDEAKNTFVCSEKFEELLKDGWVDSWRSRNPEVHEYSWFSHRGNGFRIDHALCSPAFDKALNDVSYLGDAIKGITDHACLLLDLDFHLSVKLTQT